MCLLIMFQYDAFVRPNMLYAQDVLTHLIYIKLQYKMGQDFSMDIQYCVCYAIVTRRTSCKERQQGIRITNNYLYRTKLCL